MALNCWATRTSVMSGRADVVLGGGHGANPAVRMLHAGWRMRPAWLTAPVGRRFKQLGAAQHALCTLGARSALHNCGGTAGLGGSGGGTMTSGASPSFPEEQCMETKDHNAHSLCTSILVRRSILRLAYRRPPIATPVLLRRGLPPLRLLQGKHTTPRHHGQVSQTRSCLLRLALAESTSDWQPAEHGRKT